MENIRIKTSTIKETIIAKEKECLNNLEDRKLSDGRQHPNNNYADRYYSEVGYNLWDGYKEGSEHEVYPHFVEYDNGSGGELKDIVKENYYRPAKMKSIISSSAMTYNMLGNNQIELVNEKIGLSKGIYNIKYEKQLYTLDMNTRPANLDAYLYKKNDNDIGEAIFCEMKMIEWVAKKKYKLDDKYIETKHYFSTGIEGSDATNKFIKVIDAIKEEIDNGGFYCYDVWQMFKHTLGIYNMTSNYTRQKVQDKNRRSKEALEIYTNLGKAMLLNVVFEPTEEIFDGELQGQYRQLKKLEHEGFNKFRDIMYRCGIVELFKEECNVDFEIAYMNTREFMDMFELENRKQYLGRYTI